MNFYGLKIIRFLIVFLPTITLNGQSAFPGAEGFGANASGGRGGRVIYVSNLNISGPGSLADALQQSGPRYILFKVSGIIQGTISVPNRNGDFTLAGQTSPNGIIIRGLEFYNENQPSVSNIIVRHIRSRIGDRQLFPSPNWIAEDGLTLGGVHNGIIDHCSFQHASDEAVDISRSSKITIQNSVLAETIGDHASLGGMLINYSDSSSILDSISIIKNVWNRIGGRMPEISCETPFCNNKVLNIELSNNLFWDPQIELWYEGITGFNGNFFLKMNAINNLSIARNSYGNGMFHHDLLHFSQNQLYFSGNRINLYNNLSDYQLFYCCNDFKGSEPNSDLGQAKLLSSRLPFPNINYLPTSDLKSYIQNNAGAFPRDQMDSRLMQNISLNSINTTPVSIPLANDPFNLLTATSIPQDTDLDGMPDYWETLQGLNPGIQDHNNLDLSQKITSVSGYTNLECYLNCLSDALVSGFTNEKCSINGFTTSISDYHNQVNLFKIYPNPGISEIIIEGPVTNFDLVIFDQLGKIKFQYDNLTTLSVIPLDELTSGLYFFQFFKSSDQTIIEIQKFLKTGE